MNENIYKVVGVALAGWGLVSILAAVAFGKVAKARDQVLGK